MTVAFYAAHAVDLAWRRLSGVLGFVAALAAPRSSAGIRSSASASASLRASRRASPMFVFIFTLIVSEFVAYLAMLFFGTWPKTIFPSLFWPVTLVGDIAVSAWDVPALVSASGSRRGLCSASCGSRSAANS